MIRFLVAILLINCAYCLPYYYGRDRNKAPDRKLNPALMATNFEFLQEEDVSDKYKADNQRSIHGENSGRMFGLDTGNEAADFEAGIWLMALIGTLAAAVPVAFLNPSLGFKKRSVDNNNNFANNILNTINAMKKLYDEDQQTQRDL